MNAARLTLIAGANGSGKTTLTSEPEAFRDIPLLDPDSMGKTLQASAPSTIPIASARHVLRSAKEHVIRGESFAVETTLSGRGLSADDVRRASAWFEIVLVYIGTEKVEINLVSYPRSRPRRRSQRAGSRRPAAIYSGVFRIFQPPSNAQTTPSCSTTQPKRATVWWQF